MLALFLRAVLIFLITPTEGQTTTTKRLNYCQIKDCSGIRTDLIPPVDCQGTACVLPCRGSNRCAGIGAPVPTDASCGDNCEDGPDGWANEPKYGYTWWSWPKVPWNYRGSIMDPLYRPDLH